MTTMRGILLPGLAAAALAGCAYDPGSKPEPTAVNGQARFADGKPVQNVRLNFNPTTADQLATNAQLGADGRFQVSLIPGKYTYSFEPLSGKPAAIKAIPAKYHSPDVAHIVEVAAGQEIEIHVAK
jgi:hypothetical protein